MPENKISNNICIGPEFYHEFECTGQECVHTCCTSAWTVSIDKQTYQNYLRAPASDELKMAMQRFCKKTAKEIALNPERDYARINFDGNELCPLLTESGLCSIQRELGVEYLCTTCRFYPRMKYKINGVTYKGISLSCEAAAKLALLREDGITFAELPAMEDSTKFVPAFHADTKHTNLAETALYYFEDIRLFILCLLQNREYKVWERMMILGMFMDALDKCEQNGIIDLIDQYDAMADAGVFHEELKKLPKRADIQLQLSTIVSGSKIAVEKLREKPSLDFLEFVNKARAGLEFSEEVSPADAIKRYEEIFADYYEPYISGHEYILENFLVATVFNDFFPWNMANKSAFHEFRTLAMFFALARLFLVGMAGRHKGLNDEIVVDTLATVARNYDMAHAKSITVGANEVMEKLSVESMAWYAGLLCE